MSKRRKLFRSLLALILVLASILPYGTYAFAAEEGLTEGQISTEDAQEILDDSDLVIDLTGDNSEMWNIPELQALEQEPDTTGQERLEALCNELLYGVDAAVTEEEKPATKVSNYTDYIFMDFKIGDRSRNFNWQLSSSRTADTDSYAKTRDLLYFAANPQGLLAAWLKGDGPDVRMPFDTADRFSGYKVRSTDVAQVRIYDITDGTTDFPNKGTNGTSSLYFNTSYTGNTGWEKVDTASIALHENGQILNFTSFDATYHNCTLYGIAFEPLTKNGIVGISGTNNEKGYRVYIDYIYIGPSQYKPVLVEYYNEGGVKFKDGSEELNQMHWKGYVGYGQKAFDFHWNHGKTNSSTSVWGWEIYRKDSSGNWVNQNTFTLNPTGVTCEKDTRFYLKNVTLPSTTVSSSQSQSVVATDSDKFTVTAEAWDSAVISTGSVGSPLDITIVLDRTANMGSIYGASEAATASTLKTVCNGLDKRKWAGYYRCSAWVPDWNREYNKSSSTNESGYIYYAPMRYYNNKWQAQILTGCNCNVDGVNFGREYGIYIWLNINACKHVKWVDIETARSEFYTNRKNQNSSFTSVFKVGTSRLGKVQNGLKTVLETLYNSQSYLALGAYHRVSILSYGGTVFTPGYPVAYDDKYKRFTNSDGSGVDLGVSYKINYVSYSNYEAMLETICHPYIWGRSNRVDCAMQALSGDYSAIEKGFKASTHYVTAGDYLPNHSSREGICLFVSYYPALKTDGTDTFDLDYANAAIAAAKKVKVDKTTTIYSVCLGEGLDATDQAYNRSYHQGSTLTGEANYDPLCANTFKMISSNYNTSKATALPTKDEASSSTKLTNAIGSVNGSHFIIDMNTTTLLGKFSGKWTSAKKPTISAHSNGGTASLWLHEEFNREWTFDASRPLKVYAVPYSSAGTYGTAVEIGSHTVATLSEATFNGNGYKIYLKPKANDEGFEISLQWTDAKKSYLRKSSVSLGSAAKPTNTSVTLDTRYGYKIRMDIPVMVNRNNTVGGNNIPLNNSSTSGCYKAASGDTAKDTRFVSYAQLNANVPFSGETELSECLKCYDYFMTMEEYMAVHGTAGTTATQNAISSAYGKLFEIAEVLKTTNDSGKSRLAYLGFNLQFQTSGGTDIYHVQAGKNATSFGTNTDLRKTKSDVLKTDTTFKGVATIDYDNGSTDSFGRTAYTDVSLNSTVNFYVPKIAVVDFDGKIAVDLENEAGVIDLTASNTGKNGSFDLTNGIVTYDFRNTFGAVSEEKHMMSQIETIPYTVVPQNPTKDKQSAIARQIYVLPGNVMTYDDTMFGFFLRDYFDPEATEITEGKWVRLGSYDEKTQKADNSKVHGYDAAFATVGDYHGASTVARVTKAVPEVAPIVFEFYGTGFELLSRTGPDTGTLVVEIFTAKADGTYAAAADMGYLVDTYLAGDTTLYQIPVVQFLSGKSTPAKYKVHVIPVYDLMFDHGKRGPLAVTEEQARAIAGFGEDVAFQYIPSASIAPETRGSFEPTGAYNVYVDGCRVYNSLAEDTQGIRDFVYSLAGECEANILNINSQIVDVNTKVDWTTNEANSGMLFIAAPQKEGSDVDGDTGSGETVTNNDIGFCLGMDYTLNEEADPNEDNKFYVRTEDSAYIYHGVYQTKIYYRISDTGRAMFFCTDGGGEPIRLTDAEVRQYVGNGERVTYYSSAYKALGPANEVYLSKDQGVAFRVGSDGAKVFMSLKTVGGDKVTVQAYNGTGFVDVEGLKDYCSDTEMYFDLTDYVLSDGTVMIKNFGSGILSLCNVKTASVDGTLDPNVSAKLIHMAVEAFSSEQDLPLVDENVTIRHSLNLQSDISVNLVVPVSEVEGYDRYVMECTVGGETFLPEGEIRGSLIYFTVDGLAATQMNENIHSVLHLIKGEEEYVSVEDDYSIACYAYTTLNKAEASDTIKTLCANLLRYGSMAQIYKGYMTDALADEELTEEQKTYLTSLDTVAFGNNNALLGDVATPAVLWHGKTMILDSNVTLVYVVDLKQYEGKIEDLSLRVSYEGIDGNPVNTEVKTLNVYDEENGRYSFKIDTLLAAELRTVVSAAVFAGEEQVSETLVYSADTYGNNKTGALGELCKALFAYSDSAKAYFAN